MKKIIIYAMTMLPFIGFTQKKVNGTIFIEHPAISAVETFTKAMVNGDTTAMGKLMTNDFRADNVITATPFDKGSDRLAYMRNAMAWHDQLDYYSIKTMPGAYADAFEYAKNPSDSNAVTVDTWDELKGVHKKTGVKADMYLHRSFQLTKENKIRRIMNYINPEIGNEIGRGYAPRTNGIIYNQHENINKLRLMMAAAEHGDMDKYYSYFDKDATFLDSNDPDFKTTNLEQEKAADKKMLEKYEFVDFLQSGYPDYMEYEMGNNGVLYSWWNLYLRRKSDKKVIKVPMHYGHDVNKDGKIIHTISYYNAQLLK